MKTINLDSFKRTLVDDIDYDYLIKYFNTWRAQPVGNLFYAVTYKQKPGTKRTTIRMHRLIMESVAGHIPRNYVVDHIDGNSLNNVRLNLRICTQRENMQNQTAVRVSGSCYKGVGIRQNGKFVARIRVNGKLVFLGYFFVEADAARAYNEAALKYFGEYAKLNQL